jgi:hypothetical protein
VNEQTSKPDKAEAMARVVAEYERSGLTRRRFSDRTGIAVSTLDCWRRRVRERARSRIVPVRIEEGVPGVVGGSPGFRMSLPNGIRIESCWEFPEQAMVRLLRVAGER